jgi:hypothetical protein
VVFNNVNARKGTVAMRTGLLRLTLDNRPAVPVLPAVGMRGMRSTSCPGSQTISHRHAPAD